MNQQNISKDDMLDGLDRMIELKDELDSIITELEQIMSKTFPRNYPRAESYWIGHMKSAIGGYGYSSMCSLDDTLRECEELAYWDSDDEDDEPGWREEYSRW